MFGRFKRATVRLLDHMIANLYEHCPPGRVLPQPGITFRPQIEWLEDRQCPATNVFTGLGNNDLWSNVNNWSLGRDPIATDTVELPANPHGTSTMNGNYTVQALILPETNIDQVHELQGTLSISGCLSWTNATIAGGTLQLLSGASGFWADGVLSFEQERPGQLQVDHDATLTISGDDNSHVYVESSTIWNDGTITIEPVNSETNIFTVKLIDGASIINNFDAELRFAGQPGSNIRVEVIDTNPVVFGPNRITNEGLLTLSGGVRVRLDPQFVTDAQVSLSGESVLFVEGGGVLSGGIDIGLNSELDVEVTEAKYDVTLSDLTTTGSGNMDLVTFGDGVVHIDGGGDVVLGNFVTLGGRLDADGEGSVLEITRQFRVAAGTVGHLLDGLQLYIHPGATAILAGTEFWIENASSVVNRGDFFWQHGTIYASGNPPVGPTFWNKTGGRFEIMGDYTWTALNGAGDGFVNDGRMIKSGGNSAAELDIFIGGQGTVEILQGCGTIETVTRIFEEGVTQLGGP